MGSKGTTWSSGARSGLIYTIAGVLQRGLPILLLPVYARALSPEEYGQVAIVVAATAVLGSLMSLGLEASVIRESVRLAGRPAERHRFLNTLGLFTLVAPLAAAVLLWAAAQAVGGLGVSPDLFLLGVLAAAIQTSMTVFVGAALRADEHLGRYLTLAMVQAGGTAVMTLAFVVALGAGAFGWFAGALLASALALIFGLRLVEHRWTREVSAATLRAALVYGLPLVPHTLAHWGLNLSDRIVLGAFVDHAQVGVYNLAYQAAAPISLVVVAVHQGLMPRYARAADDPGIRSSLGKIATLQVHLTAWLGMAAILLAPPVIVALFPPEYAAATSLVPWIAIGYVLFGLYVIPMDSLSLMVGKTKWLWVPTLCAAVVNVALNVTLIPRFGALAAAVSTAVSYAALVAGVLFARTRIAGPRINFDPRRIAIGLVWITGLCVVGLIAAPSLDQMSSIAVRAGLVAIGGLGLAVAAMRGGALRRGASTGGPWTPAVAAQSDDDLIMATPNA